LQATRRFKNLSLLMASLMTAACATPPPLQTVDRVEIPRFMGDWYVIASIPTRIEVGAHNAVESYRLDDKGRIQTEFTFRDGAFDGPPKRYTPVGYVRDESGALWGMQFIWPIKADYRIIYLADDYSQTIVGRQKRDYVWIMARTPAIPDADYQRHVEFLKERGYDVALLKKVPQQPRS